MKGRLLVLPLGITVLGLAGCGGDDDPAGGDGDTTPAPAAESAGGTEVTSHIVDFEFDPETLTVAAGTTVTWTNEDSARPTPSRTTATWVPTRGPTWARATRSSSPTTTRVTYPYICGIHNYMTGTITVQ